jgi:hypothetical protein
MRTIPLSDEQYTLLRANMCGDLFVHVLGEMVWSAIRAYAKDRCKAWESVYKTANADECKDSITINWVARQIEVFEGEEAVQKQRNDDARAECLNFLVDAFHNALNSAVKGWPVSGTRSDG